MNYDQLVNAALEARKKAYAPYSGFAVGAALLTDSGEVYTGCNIENAAYTPTNCAERTALFSAVEKGERRFVAIAIVGGRQDAQTLDYCYPCGVCRQALVEFCPQDMPVVVGRTPEDYRVHTLAELLPHSFTPQSLNQ